jgi:hypothetical protein
MKITELIHDLQLLYLEHGDLEVEKYISNCCYGDYTEDVEPDLINGCVVL